MDTYSSTPDGNFSKQAALASLFAPAIAIGMAFTLHPVVQGNQIGMITSGVVSVLLIFAGLILGIIGLVGMQVHGTEGILWKAIAGTAINGFLILCMVFQVPRLMGSQRDAASTEASTSAATKLNYDKYGVQFSYDDRWTVEADPGSENGNHATTQIMVQRRDDKAAVVISLYPAGSRLLDLEAYGRKLVQDSGGAADPKVEHITANIGGVDQPGVRLHYTGLKKKDFVFSGAGEFFRLQTAKHNLIVDSMTRGETEAIPEIKPILASLKIDGGNGAANPVTSITGMTSTSPAPGSGPGFFIPAINRVDMVHDLKRDVLYITADDSVLRYDLASKSFLPPYKLGGDLRGIDISPDNSRLAVADAAGSNGRVCIHLVDLDSGNATTVSFTAAFQESGTYSVAYGADGQIWISSSMSGSGFLPMRKYNPPTRSVMKLPQVSQDTMLAASADRQSIGFAEGRMTPGTYGRILYRASQLPSQLMRATNYLYEVAINKDGSQLALPGYDCTMLAGSEVPVLDEREILGAAYHPQRNYLFVSQAGTSLISVYDAAKYSRVKDLDFGDAFEWSDHAYGSGRLKLSADGFYIFCTVKNGVRYMETGL